MLNYEQWDMIADTYIPLLAFLSLLKLINISKNLSLHFSFQSCGLLILSIVSIYALMFLDIHLEMWPSLDLDYSTHTALALTFIIFLSSKKFHFTLGLWASMMLYIALMIYQQYHTLADIISTSAVVIPLVLIIYHQYRLRTKVPYKSPAHHQLIK